MFKKRYLLLVILFVLTIACSQNRKTRAEIIDINKLGNINLNFMIKDVGYDTNSKILYLAEEHKDYIWIYQNFNFVNKFGGKGNNYSSFQLLSDIEVSDNGNLLALDNLQKRISIYDKNGIYRNNISLKNYSNPTKFTLGSDDLLYLYDRDKQEIIILNLLTFQEFMRFGQFELDLPKAIRFNSDNLSITNHDYTTDFYNSLGGFKENYPNLTVKDNKQNTISLQNNFIYINNQPKAPLVIENLPIGMFIKHNNLIIYTQNEVLIYELKYQNYN